MAKKEQIQMNSDKVIKELIEVIFQIESELKLVQSVREGHSHRRRV